MHSIHILALGSAQESWQKDAIEQYLTRIRPFAQVRLTELPDEAESPTVTKATIQKREADLISKHVPQGSLLIALDETGKNLSSQEWAQLLAEEAERGIPLTCILGGASGLDPALRAKAQRVISLGKHTMPHMLARIVLLEQVYRAETILKGKTYHR